MTEVYAVHAFGAIHLFVRAVCFKVTWNSYSMWPGLAKVPSNTDEALAATNGTAAALAQCNTDCRCRSFSSGAQQAVWSLSIYRATRKAGWSGVGHLLLVQHTAQARAQCEAG